MRRTALVNFLLNANRKRERSRLLGQNAQFVDIELARSIKDTYYASWTSAPQKTINAAAVLHDLAAILNVREADALASWVGGVADLTNGRLESSVAQLDHAAELFGALKMHHDAGRTQIAKMIALAMLGNYDEAVATGKKVRKTFLRFNDLLAIGKVEKNLGNIVARQGKEKAAEKYYLAARERFIAVGDRSELAMCDNSLANTYAELNDLERAEHYYSEALESSRRSKMIVTEAEVEASLGNLARSRGRFADGIRYLELSRQKYKSLKMPHQTAIADLEIADIYLDLNLFSEAFDIYRRVARILMKLGLRGESARAYGNMGRAAAELQNYTAAKRAFSHSTELYFKEKNPTGALSVQLTEASVDLSRKEFARASKVLSSARRTARRSENPRQHLMLDLLRAETLRGLDRNGLAEKLFLATSTKATKEDQPGIAQSCLTSLGKIAYDRGDLNNAEKHFLAAAKLIEKLREPLAADEFRMSFMVDKLEPVEFLARIYLKQGNIEKAFEMFEMAKGRALADEIAAQRSDRNRKQRSEANSEIEKLREELNWLYTRLREPSAEPKKLYSTIRKSEKRLTELSLREKGVLALSRGRKTDNRGDIDLLCRSLGNGRVLIEYVTIDGFISAFVISKSGISFFANIASESEVAALISGLQFQFGALRYGRSGIGTYTEQLKQRTDIGLERLYDYLILPFSGEIKDCDLVVVPSSVLHYVPFSALRHDERYLIEDHTITNAPGAAVWQTLAKRRSSKAKNALFLGFADDSIPFVDDEIRELSTLFPGSVKLSGNDATFLAYKENAGSQDILHLACHGEFRADDPMYSSLHLADGSVTVTDICKQKLRASLVTLSACETGLNEIFPGEEIIGLARGFLSAGAGSLLLTLWTINDTAAMDVMRTFYRNLQRDSTIGASLREAQLEFIRRGEHPYYWSPFVAVGK